MSAATAPAVKQAMLALFAAAPALTGVTVTWDGPTKDEDYTGEMIWLGDVEGSEDWATVGGQLRRETYTIGTGVYVEQWGDDPQTVETRLWTVWNAATEALRTDLRSPSSTIKAAGVLQYDAIGFRQRTGPASAEKTGAVIEASIQLSALNS